MNPDAIIIGGGVIGCSIALRLARAGLNVTVIERGRVGLEASWAAAGMLAPQSETTGEEPLFDLAIRSRAMYAGFVQELRDLSGIDPEYRAEGTLCVAMNEDDEAGFAVWSAAQRRLGLNATAVSVEDVHRWEPAVADSAVGGVFLPDDHQVEKRKLMPALEASIKKLGVQVIEGREVTEILAASNTVRRFASDSPK